MVKECSTNAPHPHSSNSDGSNLIPPCSTLLAALLFSVQDYSTLQYTALQYHSLNVTYCTVLYVSPQNNEDAAVVASAPPLYSQSGVEITDAHVVGSGDHRREY